MFDVGEYIIYGNNEVCKVEYVGKLDSKVAQSDRLYYTLLPVFTKGSRIFTPADNKKVMMRAVLSKEEAYELIDDIKNIDCLWITEERNRENSYREALSKCDCRELVKIIKTIYTRQKSRILEGKKATAGDDKYFHMAEEKLYGELAITLGIDREKVKEYIVERIETV